jgi:hypothetical protein
MAFCPRAKAGEKVFFWPKYPVGGQPNLAFVLRDGERAQTLLVFTTTGAKTYPTVRHADDPDLKNHREWWPDGVWDHHPDTSKIKNLETAVEELRAELLALRQQTGTKEKSAWTEERRQKARETMLKNRAKRTSKALTGGAA